MGYVVRDGRLLVVSEHGTASDWYRNARAAGALDVHYRGEWRSATAQATDEDPGETLKLMPSRAVAMFNRLLWHRARVVQICFSGDPEAGG